MKAILIDPHRKTVSYVLISDPEDIQGVIAVKQLIGCEYLDVVKLTNELFMYVDDYGLHQDNQKFFRLGDYSQAYAGRAVVVSQEFDSDSGYWKCRNMPLNMLEPIAQRVAWCEPSKNELNRLKTITFITNS